LGRSVCDFPTRAKRRSIRVVSSVQKLGKFGGVNPAMLGRLGFPKLTEV